MVKEPTGSGGEPSSPNSEVSAGAKARHLPKHDQQALVAIPSHPDRQRRGSGSACKSRWFISTDDRPSSAVSPLDTIIIPQKMKKVTVYTA